MKNNTNNFVVKGLNKEIYRLTITNIINLYFEDADVFFDHQPSSYLALNFTEKSHLDKCQFQLILTDEQSNSYTYHNDIQLEGLSEDAQRKTKKHAISRLLITALTQYTGIVQEWGILTGIRPTKLYHKLLQQGLTHQQIHQQLAEQYLLHPQKLKLLQQVVTEQYKVLPDLFHLQNEVSIYIGIPFCPTKCAYCTFPAYSIKTEKLRVPDFLVGLHEEIKTIGQWLTKYNIAVTTIYFGGGTPTAITAEQMDALYETVYQYIPMAKVREVTVEAGRPDTITVDKLLVLNKYGIDRISVNPQSFTDATLKAIGRHHTVEETINKFKLASQYHMNNRNMDLIVGLPGENRTHLQHSLEQIKQLMPESLTVHTLSFKRASMMTKNKQKYPVASREEVQYMMSLSRQFAEQHHYYPYYLYRQKNILGNLENIGYAKEKMASLYNILIMEEVQTIIGLGCGASSKLIHPLTKKIDNFANPKDPKSYNESYKDIINKKINKLNQLYDK